MADKLDHREGIVLRVSRAKHRQTVGEGDRNRGLEQIKVSLY